MVRFRIISKNSKHIYLHSHFIKDKIEKKKNFLWRDRI